MINESNMLNAVLMDIPWAIILILLPLLTGMLCFLWPRRASFLGISCNIIILISVTGLAWLLLEKGVYRHAVGGWGAPLGIDLYADGLSLLMLIITAVVSITVSIYSSAYFKQEDSIRFWPVWLFLLAALNALFLSADIFNLYVTLELMGLSAVILTALPGSKAALMGAMRYLLATLLGSLAFLFGVALLYHNYASVDIATLAMRIDSTPATWAAMGLIMAGLALKTALFPFHFWLPPAHASAPAPVSALLSALVVKASFYILIRLWLTLFDPITDGIDTLLGLLGAAAVIWGSFQALMQTRLKLLVAYSTVAQVGYLFLAFPLAKASGVSAWSAVAYLALSHALAKTAMFLAAGNLLRFCGHDRIADFDRVVQRLPLTAAAFALAGVSIIGLPPSGGFIGKWLLLETALIQQQWGIAIVMILGSLLAGAYIFKVIGHVFTQTLLPQEPKAVHTNMEWAALLIAFAAILTGLVTPLVLPLLEIGQPFITVEIKP